MNEMELEARKREKEFSNWQEACAKTAAHTNRSPDYFIKATVYDRNMKSGTYKVHGVPLNKGMAMLINFTETKIQSNGNNNNTKKEKTKEGEKKIENRSYHEVL